MNNYVFISGINRLNSGPARIDGRLLVDGDQSYENLMMIMLLQTFHYSLRYMYTVHCCEKIREQKQLLIV